MRRCRFRYCRSSKRAQHDRCRKNSYRIFQIDETRKRIESKDFYIFRLT